MINKNLITFCLASAFVCMGLVSCSKDSDTSNPVDNPYVEEVTSSKINCTLSGDVTGAYVSQMVIKTGMESMSMWSGTSMDGKALNIGIYDLASTPKSYSLSIDITKGANISFTSVSAAGAKSFVLTSGTLNVSAVTDKSVKGTFSGEGTSTDGYLKMTNGTFELKR